MHFAAYGNRGSEISDSGKVVNAYAIDDCIKDQKVTFIKMDVEGAEYDTIYGARHTISKWKPDMAISVYHKPQDIVDLLQLCLDINPDYMFYFKHYTLGETETVAFAISR